MAVSPNTVTSTDVQNFIIDGGGGGATRDVDHRRLLHGVSIIIAARPRTMPPLRRGPF